MQVRLGYPQLEEEAMILQRQAITHPIDELQPLIDGDTVLQIQRQVRLVRLTPAMRRYIVQIVNATRQHPAVALGASPRGSLGLMRASQAWALLHGREFVTPDDVKTVAPAVLAHRLMLKAEAQARRVSSEQIIHEILTTVPVPLER